MRVMKLDCPTSLPLKIRISDLDVVSYREYVMSLFKMVDKRSRRELLEKMLKMRGRRKITRKLKGSNIFKLKAYILPRDIEVESPEGIALQALTVSNPAAIINDRNSILLLPRIGGLNFSRTLIGYSHVSFGEIQGEMRIRAKVLMMPMLSSESVEDPRVDPDDETHVYHVRAFDVPTWPCFKRFVFPFSARIAHRGDQIIAEEIEPIVVIRDDNVVLLDHFRDTFPLSRNIMLVRPWFDERKIGGVFIGEREENQVKYESLRPVPELLPIPGLEVKVGCNVVLRLSRGERLIIFHSVDHPHGTYHHFAALADDGGEIMGITDEPIISPMHQLYCGRRPATIFVCGAIRAKDKLMLFAGKDNEIIIILESEMDEVFERMKFLCG